MNQVGTFELGAFRLTSGAVLPDARLVYSTYGELADDRSNVILYPTSYGAQHSDIDWLVASDGILDHRRYFVIIPNMLGNGLSTSASHGDGVPLSVSHHDNVAAQDRLLRERFGIEQIALVYGWSMGAQQAYYWATLFPERVARVAAICGTARTTEHNLLFLKSLEAALQADPAWDGERFVSTPERGFEPSRGFMRAGQHRKRSTASACTSLSVTPTSKITWRALGSQLTGVIILPTCSPCCIPGWHVTSREASATEGDLARALGAIRARTLVMPSATDLYFTPDDCAIEARLIPGSHLVTIPSNGGHRAGNPRQNARDTRFIRSAVADLLAQ